MRANPVLRAKDWAWSSVNAQGSGVACGLAYRGHRVAERPWLTDRIHDRGVHGCAGERDYACPLLPGIVFNGEENPSRFYYSTFMKAMKGSAGSFEKGWIKIALMMHLVFRAVEDLPQAAPQFHRDTWLKPRAG